jgi:hypothetical protein
VFIELGSSETPVYAKWCLEFRETKMLNGGRVLLAVVNMYVRIAISVATFDTNNSVTDNTQSSAASIQKFTDSEVKSTKLAIDSRYI